MPFPRNLNLTPTLTMVIGAFVLVTAALVLAVQAYTSDRVVRGLGAELVQVGMNALHSELTTELNAIEEQARFTASAIRTGAVLLDDEEELATFEYAALAGTPQASLLLILTAEGRAVQVDRGAGDGIMVPRKAPITRLPEITALAEAAEKSPTGFWTPVEYVPSRSHSYVTYVVPVRDGDTYLGMVVVGVSLERLSKVTARISNELLRMFLIYDDTQLLAHPDFPSVEHKLSPTNPSLGLAEGPDDFLADHFRHEAFEIAGLLPYGMEARVGYDSQGERRFLVTQDSGEDFGELSVKIGAHFPASVLEQPFEQLYHAILLGLALLGLSLVGAGFLSHYIALPIRRAASGAKSVAALDLDAVPSLPRSIVRELDDLSAGFNAMVGGLSAFRRYVPKTLVMKLLSEGRADAPPEEREVAVLFTDIAGFTATCEGLSATETASFINHHLSLLGGEITKRGGTIDKYIGDSVMAFWGAPERLEQPAVPAALAALDIARAIRADNRLRGAQGLQPVRVRIGVHVGPLVVGDIGAPERVNYTVIGDTVNIASRLESLGKDIDPDADVIILVSGEIAAALDSDVGQDVIGPHPVKGRIEPVTVVRLMA